MHLTHACLALHEGSSPDPLLLGSNCTILPAKQRSWAGLNFKVTAEAMNTLLIMAFGSALLGAALGVAATWNERRSVTRWSAAAVLVVLALALLTVVVTSERLRSH